MTRMKNILPSINIANVLLTITLAAMVYFTAISFLDPDVHLSLPQVKESFTELTKTPAFPQNTSPTDYAMIGDQNLFHRERKIPPAKKDEAAVAKPDVTLYGTLIAGSASVAFVEDKKTPKTTPGRGKRQITLHLGDQLSGYILQQIEANRIVLAKGEEKLVVKLEEGEKRKASEQLPAAAGIVPGSQQLTAPGTASASTSTLPQQASSPSSLSAAPQKAAIPAAPSYSQAQAQQPQPGTGGIGVPGSRPQSRQAMLQEVQQRKQEMQSQQR